MPSDTWAKAAESDSDPPKSETRQTPSPPQPLSEGAHPSRSSSTAGSVPSSPSTDFTYYITTTSFGKREELHSSRLQAREFLRWLGLEAARDTIGEFGV